MAWFIRERGDEDTRWNGGAVSVAVARRRPKLDPWVERSAMGAATHAHRPDTGLIGAIGRKAQCHVRGLAAIKRHRMGRIW